MLKVETTLSPQLLRYHMQNIEGFRQVQPLGPLMELTHEETGRPRDIVVTFTRPKNTGMIIVLINVYSPVIKEQVIPEGWESAVYVGNYKDPGDVYSMVETFLDALQACFIYESLKDIHAHKASMMDHILDQSVAYVVL